MSTLFIIITALKLLICVLGVAVIIYWHHSTHGTWRQWAAGRSLMGLLGIIALGYGWRGANRLLDPYPLEEPLLAVLYVGIATALAMIGVTIHKEMKAGKARLLVQKSPESPAEVQTGMVAVVIATNTEEKPDGKL